MLLFAIQLDEERIKRDVSLYEIKDGIRYYTRNIDDNDYQYLWMVNMAFDKCDWFKKYVKVWRYIDIEDGLIIEEEDLLEDE